MSKNCFILILVFIIRCYSQSSTGKCPEWIQKEQHKFPACPDIGTVVPETNPLGAFVISDKSIGAYWRTFGSKSTMYPSLPQTVEEYINRRILQGQNFAAEIVEAVIKASGDKPPLFMLPVESETIDKIHAKIDLLAISEQQKNKLKEAMIRIPGPRYQWQQDYFEAFKFMKRTGIRQVPNYRQNSSGAKQLKEAAELCGFRVYEPIKMGLRSKSSYGGGNIETLPGSICLLGNGDFKTNLYWRMYAKRVCGSNKDNHLKVPTWWLQVGGLLGTTKRTLHVTSQSS